MKILSRCKLALILVPAIIVFAAFLSQLRTCGKFYKTPSQATSASEKYKVPESIYRPPIVKLPFIKDRQPISKERLPIPKKSVDKSIRVTLPEGKTIDLIINKKGEVFTPTDLPKDVKVTVTKWKPLLIDLTLRTGYAAVWNGRALFHCVTIDLIHIDRFSLGAEAGLANGPLFMAGVSGKYRFYNITPNLALNALVGWDLINHRAYTGVSLTW